VEKLTADASKEASKDRNNIKGETIFKLDWSR
jgi:hypothetical protein